MFWRKMKDFLKKNWLLLAILLAALLVRFIGCRPGLLLGQYPDEDVSYSSATNMIIFQDFNPRRWDYPSGTALLHLLIFRTIFLPIALFKLFFPHPRVFFTALRIGSKFLKEFQQPIFGWRAIEALYWSRYITAFLGTGVVFATYLLAKKLFCKTVGLLAAFLLAFNYRQVISSHLPLTDIPNSLFSVLSLYCAALLLEKNTRKRYLFAGLINGFVFSLKYQVFAVPSLLFVQLIWVIRKKSLKEFFNKDFILACFLIPIVFIALNPYLFANLKQAIPMIRWVAGRYGMGAKRLNFYPLFYLYVWGIGKIPSLILVFGALFALLLRPLEALLLLTFVVPFFYIFIYYCSGGGYVRNFVPVIPFLMIFGGYGLSLLYKTIRHFFPERLKSFAVGLLVLACLLVNFSPMKNSMILSYHYSLPINAYVFNSWFKKYLPKNIQLRIYPDYLPEHELLFKGRKVIEWDRDKEDSLAEFQKEGDDFLLMNVNFNFNFEYWWFDLKPQQMIKYAGLPEEILANSYRGLMVRELLPYTVTEVYKSWQAAGEINYLLVKIPLRFSGRGKKIASFNFDKDEEGWQVKGDFDQKTTSFLWNADKGYLKSGSLEIDGGGNDLISARFTSPPIKVNPNKYYWAEAKIKNAVSLKQENRNAFLRLDFYNSLEDNSTEKISLKVALSERVWGEIGWQGKKVGTSSPNDANYLTISFQRSDLSPAFSSFFDKVILYESDEISKETFPELPYIKATIPSNLLYPNSIL